jgi:hypothetical protein
MRAALPCLAFSTRERAIVLDHGFLTWPIFLDNGFVQKKGKINRRQFDRALKQFGIGLIQFAVLPDNELEESQQYSRSYPDINWIYPLHRIDDDFSQFTWVGFPHREAWRNYSLTQFLEATQEKKRWYLGFWDESKPQTLLRFDGFDTTLPETYSGVYGKLWKDWGNAEEAPPLIPTIEIFTHNVLCFKFALYKLFRSLTLEAHLT